MALSRPMMPLLATALVACGRGGHDAALARPVIDTLDGGVVRVTNPGPTRWADSAGWRLEAEGTIAPHPGDPGELTDPRAIALDSRGRIFVLDSKPARLLAFDPDGRFVGRFASEGEGPGEISDRTLLMVSRDTVLLQDQNQTRALVLTRDGQLVGSWPSRCCIGLNTWADTAGHYPVPAFAYAGRPGPQPWASLGFVRFRSNGTVVDSFPFPTTGVATRTWDAGGKPIPIPLQPADRYAFDGGGRIVVGHQSRYLLTVLAPSGDTLRIFDAPATIVAIPDSVRTTAFQTMLSRVPGLDATARLEDLPRNYPAWSDVRTDGADRIWVLATGEAGPEDHWDVFDPDGILLGRVPAPFTDLQRSAWESDRVAVVAEEPGTGLPTIHLYRIISPEGQ